MADSSWGPGWPNCQSSKMRALNVAGVSFGSVRYEIYPLMRGLIEECMRRGYQFKNGQCWGYNCRPVRGSTTTPSNHSWGLALDFNSVYNWLGRTDGGDIPVWMRDLWKAYGFRWGGDFSGRKDPMHFEYMGTRSSVDSQMAKFNRMRAEQAARELEEADDMKFDQFREGWEAYMEGKDVKAVWSNEKKFGWRAARFAAKNPRPEKPTP